MSRSRRAEPSSGCWMRSPKHIHAERQLADADDELRNEGIVPRHRKAIPPNAYDDLLVSQWRGQSWSKRK